MEKGDIVEVVIGFPGSRLHPPLVKGNQHVVNNVIICPRCKCVYLDIGFPLLSKNSDSDCCGVDPKNSPDVAQYDSRFFRKIEPNYKVVEVSEEILKKELVFN